MRGVRGARIAMVFQDPMTALNPTLTVGEQIVETILAHQQVSQAEARAKALDWLKRVRVTLPERRLRQYPHELSGGMRQRVMLAIAFSCRPEVLLADEPTTALDVTVQAQILDLMDELKAELGTAIVLITHDLGVVAERCDTSPSCMRARSWSMPRRGTCSPSRRAVHAGPAGVSAGLAAAPERRAAALPARPAAQPDPHPPRLPLRPPLPEAFAPCPTRVPANTPLDRRPHRPLPAL